ncbi:hypothetical protein D9M72_543450 [compost metagenome]
METRIGAGDLQQDRQHDAASERYRHVNPQPAGEVVPACRQSCLDAKDVVQRTCAYSEVGLAVVGQHHFPSGPIEQLHPEAVLETGDALPDGGFRDAELFRGSGEASGSSCGDEGGDTAQVVELIHSHVFHGDDCRPVGNSPRPRTAFIARENTVPLN